MSFPPLQTVKAIDSVFTTTHTHFGKCPNIFFVIVWWLHHLVTCIKTCVFHMIGREPWKSWPLIFALWMLQSPKQTLWVRLSTNSNSEIYFHFKEEEEKTWQCGIKWLLLLFPIFCSYLETKYVCFKVLCCTAFCK